MEYRVLTQSIGTSTEGSPLQCTVRIQDTTNHEIDTVVLIKSTNAPVLINLIQSKENVSDQ